MLLRLKKWVLNRSLGSSERDRLTEFGCQSQNFTFNPRVGVPGRVFSTLRPEWLPKLDNDETFVRSTLAATFGLNVCLAGKHWAIEKKDRPIVSVGTFLNNSSRSRDPFHTLMEEYSQTRLVAFCSHVASMPGFSPLSCHIVPVVTRGKVAAVTVFFDTDSRDYDADCLDLAIDIASLIGDSYSSK